MLMSGRERIQISIAEVGGAQAVYGFQRPHRLLVKRRRSNQPNVRLYRDTSRAADRAYVTVGTQLI